MIFLLCFLLSSSTTFAHAASLKAGFGEATVQIPEGTPLGGFGTNDRRVNKITWHLGQKNLLFKPSLGTLDPIRSKTFLIDNGTKKLLFVSLDLVGVTASFRSDLLKRLKARGYSEDNLFVGATHTHSGPGAMSKNLFWSGVALDLYQQSVYEAVMSATLDSIAQAETRLEPATVSHSSVEIPGLQHNRRGHDDQVDRKAHFIWAKDSSGAVLGVLANFAIHGTAFGSDNLFFSADIPGGIEHALKDKISQRNAVKSGHQKTIVSPVVVFMNSAEGDISPDFTGQDGITKTGLIFSDYAIAQVDTGVTMPSDWQVLRTNVKFGSAGLSIKNCVDEFTNKPYPELKYFSVNTRLLAISPFFPKQAQIFTIKWGGMDLMTWPGEPTEKLGAELKAVATASGASDAMVLGLTNDHLAYFTSPDEFDEGGYESCFSVYGSTGGEKVIQGYKNLLSNH